MFKQENIIAVSNKYRSAAFARAVEGGYQVSCVQCCAYIGELSGDGLLRAIMATSHRGGVVCPDCRQRTCDLCGLTYDEGAKEKLTLYYDEGATYRVCTCCDLVL